MTGGGRRGRPLPERLLLWFLPATPRVEAALGDIHEEWRRRRRSRGRVVAGLWYAVELISLVRYGTGLRPGGVVAELRGALRRSLRRPLPLLTGLLTLTPALAAAAVGLTVTWVVLLRPLPHPEADRLVVVEHTWKDLGATGISSALHGFYEETARGVDRLGLVTWLEVGIVPPEGAARRVAAARADADYLELLGARARLGRLFAPEEDAAGTAPVVLLTSELWDAAFGRDPGIVGRSVDLGGTPHTVVGVLEPGLEFPGGAPRLVLPAGLEASPGSLLDIGWFYALGRLEPGTDAERLQSELSGLLRRAVVEAPDGRTSPAVLDANRIEPLVTPLHRWETGPARDFVVLLAASVGLLLLLSVGATSNVLLGRAEARVGELELRRTLGASRGRLLGQFAAEALVLCLLAAVPAGLLASWGATTILGAPSLGLPRTQVGGTEAVAAGTALLLGLLLLPLFTAIPLGPDRWLRGRRRASGGGRRVTGWSGMRKVLLGAQVAFTTVLLVAGVALAGSLRSLAEAPVAYETESVLSFLVDLPEPAYGTLAATMDFHERMADRLQALPGVRSVGFGDAVPGRRHGWSGALVRVEDRPEEEAPATHRWAHVSEGFFDALEVPLVAGRYLDDRDRLEGRPVAVVEREFAQAYWGEPSRALGRRLTRVDSPWYEIVGVVEDLGEAGSGDLTQPAVLVPFATGHLPEWAAGMAAFVVSAQAEPQALLPPVRRALEAVEPGAVLYDPATLAERLVAGRARERIALQGVGFSGAASVAVVVASLVGLLLLDLARRRREMGIRKSVGATDRELRWLMVRGVAVPTAVGLAVGSAAVLAGARVPPSLLHGGVDAVAPLLPTAALLLGASLLVGYGASRGVVRVEPAEALRSD